MGSERLPGKPLMEIAGLPMVVRVAKVCAAVVGSSGVTVSTPDQEIVRVCEDHGVNVHLSSLACQSGTDRLAEFSKAWDGTGQLVNVQGDEPMLTPEVLSTFLDACQGLSGTIVAVSRIYDPDQAESESTVKVARSNGKLVYASRRPLPAQARDGSVQFWKHTGLYSFSTDALNFFASTSRGPLECAENVEILRLIERGQPVSVVEVPAYGRAVDTERDLLYAREVCKVL